MQKIDIQKTKDKITKNAVDFGFEDVRFIKYKNASYILAFKPFDPGMVNTDKDKVSASIYYATSNFTDKAAGKLSAYITDALNIKAIVVSDDVYVKSVAITSGGMMGLNSLYYHPEFGSIFSVQALRIYTDLSDKKYGESSKCRLCLKCIDACPTGAISKDGLDKLKCIRDMMDAKIPEHHRDKPYQLFSCELCQLCCPENPIKQNTEPVTFDIQSILKEEQTQNITDFCGTYVGTRDRILREAILMAAKNNLTSVTAQLKVLRSDADERISKYATWALDQLQD